MSELDALHTLVGRMTVGELARHLNLTVSELVEAVLEPARSAAPGERRSPAAKASARSRRSTSPSSATEAKPRRSSGSSSSTREPTRNELHEAVDRWILGEALEQHDGNITHVADHLGVNRKRIRQRWARVRKLDAGEMQRRFGRVKGARTPPSPEELRALGALNEIHAAVDRWMIGHVLEQEGGNVTLTTQRLGTSRRLVRDLRARIRRG